MDKKTLAKQALATLGHFTGTEQWHRVYPNLLITDGVKFLCDNAGSFWLLDIIWSYLGATKKDEMLQDMQFWHLRQGPYPKLLTGEKLLAAKKVENAAAHVICERDSDNVAIVQEIEFTDFPFDALSEVKLYVQNQGDGTFIACLPSEY